MEIDNAALNFIARLGNTLSALEAEWPESINIQLSVEYHGEDIASWGSVEGETVWSWKARD